MNRPGATVHLTDDGTPYNPDGEAFYMFDAYPPGYAVTWQGTPLPTGGGRLVKVAPSVDGSAFVELHEVSHDGYGGAVTGLYHSPTARAYIPRTGRRYADRADLARDFPHIRPSVIDALKG